MKVVAIDRPDVPPLDMPERFKFQIVYFMTPSGEHGAPALAPGEYWIRLEDARKWLDELVVYVVSPLDAASQAEIELTDEQEAWLQWLVDNGIERVKLA